MQGKNSFTASGCALPQSQMSRCKEHEWKIGDRLVGECRCDSSKTIEFVCEYVSECKTSFVFKHPDGESYTLCTDMNTPTPETRFPIGVYSNKYNRDYHNWRRVPEGYGCIYCSGIGTPKGIVDYEFGDTIKVRGFEYEIHNSTCQGVLPCLKKKEPERKKIQCIYEARPSNFSAKYYEVSFNIDKDAPRISYEKDFVALRTHTGHTFYNDKHIVIVYDDVLDKWSAPVIVPKEVRDKLDSICAEISRVLTEEANR